LQAQNRQTESNANVRMSLLVVAGARGGLIALDPSAYACRRPVSLTPTSTSGADNRIV
jgi:hypothetical protein